VSPARLHACSSRSPLESQRHGRSVLFEPRLLSRGPPQADGLPRPSPATSCLLRLATRALPCASMNAAISLEDFKFIFFMEWAHRNLGRLLGVTFVLPALYFTARGKMARKDQWKAFGLACGIGFQVRQPRFCACDEASH
jgi:hypothetical protein